MARDVPSSGSGDSGNIFPTNLADVKELWNMWEVHFLILLSFFLQVLLFFFAGMRRRSSSTILRAALWLAYLSADSVAIFALGHLMVHAEGPRHHLMYFWAPFVLVHLGGQDTITAFSKQDNELWRRHLLNLVTQVAVAGFVVAKASWPDRRLRTATVIMFLSGCFKYAGRILCLYISRPLGLYKISLSEMHRNLKDMKLLAKAYKDITTEQRERKENFKTQRFLMTEVHEIMLKGSWIISDRLIDIMSVDAPHSQVEAYLIAEEMPGMLAEFKSHAGRCEAYKCVGASLEDCYLRLHTKYPIRQIQSQSIFDIIYCQSYDDFLFFVIAALTVIFQHVSAPIALVLFMAAEKGDRLHTSRADIAVSFILLVGAIALDVCSFFSNLRRYPDGRMARIKSAVYHIVNCIQPAVYRKQWAEEIAQYNMIKTCILETELPAYTVVFGTTTQVPIDDKSRTPIKEIILDNLLCWGEMEEWNISSSRGKLSIQKWMDKHQDPDSVLEKSIIVDFPTSILIWHIATDMCYYCGDNSTTGTHQMNKDNQQVSRELSNYIMYLVFECGVKRTASSQIVHDRVNQEIMKIFLTNHQQVKKLSEVDAVMELFEPKEAKQQDSNNEIQKAEEQQYSSVIQVQKFQELGDEQDSTVTETQQPEELDEEQQDSSLMNEIQKPTELDNTQDAGVAKIQKQKELDHEQDSMAAESQKQHAERGDSNLQKLLQRTPEDFDYPVLPCARELARELLNISDAAERWDLIVGVWSEMLFYAAPRCGGAFHYEHLTTGGEFVTHVLLLMKFLGPFLPPPGA